jgi:hypothetical protein
MTIGKVLDDAETDQHADRLRKSGQDRAEGEQHQ